MEEDLEATLIRPKSEWQRESVCARLPEEERKSFQTFREGRPSLDDERYRICSNCPVKMECLLYAIVHDEYGVWGGTSLGERKKISPQIRNHLKKKAKREGWYQPLKNFLPTILRPKQEEESFLLPTLDELENPLDLAPEPVGFHFPEVPEFVLP